MKRVALLTAALLMFGFAGSSCKKKEPPAPPPAAMPGMPGMPPGAGPGMPPGQPGATAPTGVDKKTIVPDGVKGAWKAVKIEVDFKDKKSKKQYTIPLNSDFKVPDSDITLKVGDFLPHFTMTADSYSSASNNLENPAVTVEVVRGGKQAFKGWLFAKYPDVHKFQDDKLGILFVEPIKK